MQFGSRRFILPQKQGYCHRKLDFEKTENIFNLEVNYSTRTIFEAHYLQRCRKQYVLQISQRRTLMES